MNDLFFADIEERVRALDVTLLPDWTIVPSDATTKHPRFERWQTFDHAEPEARAEMAQRIPHDAWSLLCGPSGVYVIDLDEKPDEDGLAEWVGLLGDTGHPEWNPRIVGSTPSGGRHLYFAPPGEGYRGGNTSRLLPGIDSRGAGGQVLIAGPGRMLRIFDWHLPPLPSPWLDLVRLVPGSHPYAGNQGTSRADLSPTAKGRALQAACEQLATTGEGARNAYLNWAAYVPGREALEAGYSLDAVVGELLNAASACGLDPREAHKTVESGLGVRL